MEQLQCKNSLTITDRLTELLTTAIVKGDLAPGEKVNEPELARTFKVSRGPLREAICRLEGLHLVKRVPHVGTRVISLSSSELLEIYDTREALEGMAARLAARQMESGEIDELQRLLDIHEKSIDESNDSEYFQREGDFDFHYCIIRGSKNRHLIELLCSELYHLLRMYRYRSSQGLARPSKALAEHRHLLQAIAQRDEEFAEMLMRRHIQAARKNLEQDFLTEED